MNNLLEMGLTPLGRIDNSTAARLAIQQVLSVLGQTTPRETAGALTNRVNQICGEYGISADAVHGMDIELQGLYNPTLN